jgi:uncharacterized membrane protein YdjX (TVP38/TMEM64 family)
MHLLPASLATGSSARIGVVRAFASPAEAAVSVCEWASSHGALGLIGFAAAHTVAVLVCFPATVLFEFAAGFAFGVYSGAAIAWAAKVVAALLAFWASRGIARVALQNAGVEAAAAHAFRSQPALARLADSIEEDGARYTLLARLSPIPSWLNNYGLAFAGVRFADYAPATALATVLPVLMHTYAGSLMPSVLALSESEGGALPSTLASSVLAAASVLGGGLLLTRLLAASAALDEPIDPPPSRRAPREGRPWRRTRGDPTAGMVEDGEDSESADGLGTPQDDPMLITWRAVRNRSPPLLTGAGATDGEDDPAGALFNTFFIRLPFLALLGAVAVNVLLGGGVTLGGLEWPPPSPTDALLRVRGGSTSPPSSGTASSSRLARSHLRADSPGAYPPLPWLKCRRETPSSRR